MSRVAVVWFRQDLRLKDNPALSHAVKDFDAIVPLYILEESGEWSLGGASKWWLHQSLKSLQQDLEQKGSTLILRQGKPLEVLQALSKEISISAIYWNRCYEPEAIARDKKIKAVFLDEGVEVKSFNASLLFEPWEIKNKQGGPYKVYTPFWNVLHVMNSQIKSLAAPSRIPTPAKKTKSLKLKDLALEPKIKWDAGICQTWTPGEAAAHQELRKFLKGAIEAYSKKRDRPDHVGTSRLSPYLHFGEISPRQIWQAIRKGTKTIPYLRQIVWREFAFHLLYHFPHTPSQPLAEKFKKFPWRQNIKALRAWQKGMTGYPIVDAGMRELWHTGWMHNRVRMIVASFLVKDLMIPWQKGAEWFWDTLVDADLANNTMGWQWVAGCGADAAPFFRIFNPVTQGEKFDPDGVYVRRWIPELAGLPNQVLQKPWMASSEDLKQAGVTLGKTYPKPIVDHNLARREALLAYERIK